MNPKAIILTTLICCLAGCGDDLVDNHYQGDPLVTINGGLAISPSDRPNDTLQVLLVWNVEDSVDLKVSQYIDVQGDSIGQYSLSLMVPPPDQALNLDPETGGRIGFAWIMAYDDPLGEGPINLSKVDPEDYGKLMYRWRGGSESILLAYAQDSFAAGTQVADTLGEAIESGFYLVLFEGDCYCYPGTHGNCVDSQNESCARNDMRIIPLETPVDLNVVDNIADFRMVPPPDWLFL